MYKYVLFDLDGTLTNPKEGITKCVQYALNKFGIEADTQSLLGYIGPPLDWSFTHFHNIPKEDAKKAVAYYRERYTDIGIFENSLIDGFEHVLKVLKENGHILAVSTSKPTVFAKRILDKYNVSEYFDVIVGSEMDGRRTAKNEVIEYTLECLGIDQTAPVIMVGDRSYDVEGAAAFGIPTIGVTFGFAAEGELEKAGAKYIVTCPEEIIPIVS